MLQVSRTVLLLLAFLQLAACNNKLAALTPEELRDRIYECERTAEPGPGLAIACDNYRRECERRRNAGQYVC